MENKITYEEIDDWARSVETRSYAYKKTHPTHKVLALKVSASGEKRLSVFGYYNLGFFDGHNSKKLFEDFYMRNAKGWNAEELIKLNGYGFPVKEWYYKNKEKVDLFKEEMAPKKRERRSYLYRL